MGYLAAVCSAKLTLAEVTPGTFSNACSTVATQPAQLMLPMERWIGLGGVMDGYLMKKVDIYIIAGDHAEVSVHLGAKR